MDKIIADSIKLVNLIEEVVENDGSQCESVIHPLRHGLGSLVL